MFVAVLTIVIGALQTAGGAQELVVQGIMNSQRDPLIGGTLGTVAGSLTLSAGISLLRRSPQAVALTRAAAMLTIPVTVLIGFVWGLAGWPMRLIGIAFPLFLLAYFRRPPAEPAAV